MIPTFPNFKPLELQDRDAIIACTKPFLPFSDFNFVSLWAWNLDEDISIAMLNKNLVIRFSDYDTSEPFFSFIGTTDVNATIATLLTHSSDELGRGDLKLIPETTTDTIDLDTYNISVDRDNFDYIFTVDELRKLAGKKYSKRRNTVKTFLKNIEGVQLQSLSLSDTELQKEIANLFQKIDARKLKLNSDLNPNLPVFQRLLHCVDISTFLTTGIYVDDKLVAVLVNEIINDQYAVAHLMTADTDVHAGLYAYLMQQNAELLHRSGVTYLNFEQDLGLENLRKAKTLYRPSTFLRKYQLAYLHDNKDPVS